MTIFINSAGESINRVRVVSVLLVCLLVAGCVSSSSTSSYRGPSIASVTSKRADAAEDRRAALGNKRTARKDLASLERRIKQDSRRIKRKRISSKFRSKVEARLKKNKSSLRAAKRRARKTQRDYDRALKREERAKRAVQTAKKRKAEADRRQVKARRREAEEQKRLALAEKRKEQEKARQEISRDKPKRRFGGGLFSLSDPVLQNVKDYGARVDGSFPVAAIPVNKINKRLLRQEVRYRTSHKPGTLIVDPNSRFLYLVQSGGRALRYGIGVGKAGFEWNGEAHVGWKQEWPKWTPPVEMIERRPDLAKYCADCGGMPGGPENPLGARALYLMQGGVDTLYRLHGTPQWQSIGTAASSGCIRLMNQDIIDLYGRVPHGTKVVVL